MAQTSQPHVCKIQQDLALLRCVCGKLGGRTGAKAVRLKLKGGRNITPWGIVFAQRQGRDDYLDCVLGLACLVRPLVIWYGHTPAASPRHPERIKREASQAVSQEASVDHTVLRQLSRTVSLLPPSVWAVVRRYTSLVVADGTL